MPCACGSVRSHTRTVSETLQFLYSSFGILELVLKVCEGRNRTIEDERKCEGHHTLNLEATEENL